MQENKVAAFVVTYNRLALLKECVFALQHQTRRVDKIFVINNSSTDGTAEWLNTQQQVQTITQPNEGGAAGFYTGLKTAYEQGYEWVWCMDDDGRPALNALEILLQHNNLKPCVLNCLVVANEDDNKIVFKTGKYLVRSDIQEEIIAGAANFFNGTLFHYSIINKVGLPIKELVIWGDESEYFNRIKFEYKFKLCTIAKSLHYHPSQSGVFYKKEWDIKKDWKPYFYIRNKKFVLQSMYNNTFVSTLKYLLFLLLFAATILFFQKHNKWKKIVLLCTAGKDGLSNNLTRSIIEVRTKFCR